MVEITNELFKTDEILNIIRPAELMGPARLIVKERRDKGVAPPCLKGSAIQRTIVSESEMEKARLKGAPNYKFVDHVVVFSPLNRAGF